MQPVFPGMDPYLEAPGVWQDFHDAFLFCVREALQPLLPDRYYAALGTREEIGIAGYSADLILYPDVAVKRRERRSQAPTGSTKTAPVAAAPEHLVVAPEESFTVSFVEVRETVAGGRLVTIIELLSPSNKTPGPDREAFERKERETFATGAHWVEIDLLRAGKRLGGHPRVEVHCRAKHYDYVAAVSRSSARSPLDLELYGFTVRDPLPVLGIPLRDPDPDVPLDLGQVFARTYETGPYAKIVRYDLPAEPPLPDDDADWAKQLVAARGVRQRG